jgi:predicted transcriptional regulator
MKVSLELLEKDREAGLKLERILKNLGFEDDEFFQSENNIKLARKKVLNELNSRIKEVDELINKFNIKELDKKEK